MIIVKQAKPDEYIWMRDKQRKQSKKEAEKNYQAM